MITHSTAIENLTPRQIAKAFERVNIEIKNPLGITIMLYEDVSLVRDGNILKTDRVIVATPTEIGIAMYFNVRSIVDKKCWLTGSVGCCGADLNFTSVCLSTKWPIAIQSFEIDMSNSDQTKPQKTRWFTGEKVAVLAALFCGIALVALKLAGVM